MGNDLSNKIFKSANCSSFSPALCRGTAESAELHRLVSDLESEGESENDVVVSERLSRMSVYSGHPSDETLLDEIWSEDDDDGEYFTQRIGMDSPIQVGSSLRLSREYEREVRELHGAFDEGLGETADSSILDGGSSDQETEISESSRTAKSLASSVLDRRLSSSGKQLRESTVQRPLAPVWMRDSVGRGVKYTTSGRNGAICGEGKTRDRERDGGWVGIASNGKRIIAPGIGPFRGRNWSQFHVEDSI